MKKLLFVLTITASLFASNVFGQFTTYSNSDNLYNDAVFDIEDLNPNEIKSYNFYIENGIDKNTVMFLMNAGRAYENLLQAPATIIDFHTKPDFFKEYEDAINIEIELINTTSKTIKEISFEFEFENSGTPVYDIKTGDKSCKLIFNNLKGRTKSQKYTDILSTILDCYHILDMNKSSFKKLFHNKKANALILKKCNIKYTDGSTSNKVAIFDNGYFRDNNILNSGPLKPLDEYSKKTRIE